MCKDSSTGQQERGGIFIPEDGRQSVWASDGWSAGAFAPNHSQGWLGRTYVSLRTTLHRLSRRSGIHTVRRELCNLSHRIRESTSKQLETRGPAMPLMEADAVRRYRQRTRIEIPDCTSGIGDLIARRPVATFYDCQLFLEGYFWARAEAGLLVDNVGIESQATTPVA